MAEKPTLSTSVAAKFKMAKNFIPGKYNFRGKEIDLTTASLEIVEAAVELGFDIVEPVKEAKAVKP